jgi:hypothetical protein
LQLHSISSGLKTIPFPCLTFLSIQDLSISSSDIISLILPIPSLAVLELRPYHIGSVFSSIYHDEGIDERGMRTWIRAVREGKSLRDLKVLVLRLMDVDQGWDDILSDLFTELPSLQLLRLETKRSKCNVEVMAENNSENTTPKRNWSRVKLFEM